MSTPRTKRLNPLLVEVISEVIHRDIHHVPHLNEFVTITRVDITADLSYAKVYVSVIGKESEKAKVLEALNDHARQIGMLASKKVVMRHFPILEFHIDTDLEKQLHMEALLHKIAQERAQEPGESEETPPSTS